MDLIFLRGWRWTNGHNNEGHAILLALTIRPSIWTWGRHNFLCFPNGYPPHEGEKLALRLYSPGRWGEKTFLAIYSVLFVGTTLLHMLTHVSCKSSYVTGLGESHPAPDNFRWWRWWRLRSRSGEWGDKRKAPFIAPGYGDRLGWSNRVINTWWRWSMRKRSLTLVHTSLLLEGLLQSTYSIFTTSRSYWHVKTHYTHWP